MRLIDGDALGIGPCKPELFEKPGYADGWNSAISILQKAPTIDPVKHGRWEFDDPTEPIYSFRCSECGTEHEFDVGLFREQFFRFCPNCGARMDADEEKR